MMRQLSFFSIHFHLQALFLLLLLVLLFMFRFIYFLILTAWIHITSNVWATVSIYIMHII